MLQSSIRRSAEEFQLKEAIALNHLLDRESVLLFGALEIFLSQLCENLSFTNSRLITAAPAVAEIAIAADRAEIELVSACSESPFATDIESIAAKLESGDEIIYLANPNRITGATYSNLQIRQLANSIENGILIVDEYYHDFSGLTAQVLLGVLPNLVVLRSFENWQLPGHIDAGYAIISEQLIERLSESIYECAPDRITAKKCLDIFNNKKTRNEQVKNIHRHSLELATSLSNLGLRVQISPTNRLIIHSDSSESVHQALLKHDISLELVTIENTDTQFLLHNVSNSETNMQLEQAFMKILSKSSPKTKKQAVTV